MSWLSETIRGSGLPGTGGGGKGDPIMQLMRGDVGDPLMQLMGGMMGSSKMGGGGGGMGDFGVPLGTQGKDERYKSQFLSGENKNG